MADQDAQDISQMMSATSDVKVGKPKKSMFLWVVLGCVVVGVGLGILVYQQSVKPTVKPSATPKPTPIVAKPSPVPSPVVPETNLITPLANTINFPEAGKIRVFNDLNNIQLVVVITIGGVKNTLTMPSKANTESAPMHSADSTFEVKAGDVGTIEAYLNSTSGPKMGGWLLPGAGDTCGANGAVVVSMTPRLTWALSQFPAGRPVYAKQCWADDIDPKDPSSYDFNDFFLVWGYAGAATTASASPAASGSPKASVSPSPSAKASVSPSPSPSVKASASPSPSVKASTVAAATPTPSPRAVMPDTSEGTPVTGIFEVTVGTISVGLILLILGLFGLLAL